MKKSFKIILLVSLIVNVVVIGLQLYSYWKIKSYKTTIKPDQPRMVNWPIAKKNFLDSLILKYPELKDKKYLFFHFWSTHHFWCTKPLPIYDTLILPRDPKVGYVLVNDEEEELSKKVLRDDSGTTKNFLFAFKSEDFILAVNQELKFKPSRHWYPKYPMSMILEKQSGKILFFDTVGILGPRFPEDSLDDKKSYSALKKALAELK